MKDFTINLAKEAGKILMNDFGRLKTIKKKGQNDFVTNADYESEKFIISKIQGKYPEHSILSEEKGEIKNDSDYEWYIDPLDGTTNFVHGLPMFGVSIGLAKKGESILGVIYLPFFNEMYVAEKGKGAYLNGKKIHVSDNSDVKNSLVNMSSTRVVNEESYLKKIMNILTKFPGTRIIGGASFNTCQLAKGCLDAYILADVKPWYVAAGFLIVKEAGGKVSNFDGSEWAIKDKKDVFASNGKIHNQILELLK